MSELEKEEKELEKQEDSLIKLAKDIESQIVKLQRLMDLMLVVLWLGRCLFIQE